MLHLKQIQHNLLDQISSSILRIKTDSESLGRAVLNFPLAESLGILLSSLTLLVVTLMYLIVICISSLLWLMNMMWTKWLKRLMNIAKKALMSLYMLCPWVGDRKNTNSIQEESQNWQWSEAGAIPPDYTSTSSETLGELNETLDVKARKAGL